MKTENARFIPYPLPYALQLLPRPHQRLTRKFYLMFVDLELLPVSGSYLLVAVLSPINRPLFVLLGRILAASRASRKSVRILAFFTRFAFLTTFHVF